MDCIFCKIINGEVPSEKVYENDSVYAFEDINPVSPVHVLVIPKLHVKNINELTQENSKVMSEVFLAVKEVAKIKGLEKGYRVIINNDKAGGQVVWHLHIHVLGGKDSMGPMILRTSSAVMGDE